MNKLNTRFGRAGAFTLVELPAVSERKVAGFTLVELPAVSKRKARGFTLVDLLVVIGIIALLISTPPPAINKARESAVSLQCMASLRQYGMSDLQYMNSNRGWHLPG